MALLDRFLNRSPIVEEPQPKPTIFQAVRADVGVVDSDTAFAHAPVFTAVLILSDTMASVGAKLYRKTSTGRERAVDHPLYTLLTIGPNEYMSAYEYYQIVYIDLHLRGNHYAQIIRNGAGDVVGLYPLLAQNMEVALKGRKKVYVYRPTKGAQVALRQDEVFHLIYIPDRSGLVGVNVFENYRRAVELSMTVEQYGKNFFANGANGSGILKHPRQLSDEAYERLRKSFEEKYQGLSNSGKPIILEEGMDYTRLSLSNEDSQFLETRRFQKSEIAAMFRVPPYMLGDMSKSTFNNMEEMSRTFVKYTLDPLARRFESALRMQLLKQSEQSSYYAKFNLNSLMRGDPKTRAEYYRTLLNIGAITPNEVRALEELDPKGSEADELYMQINMGTLKRIADGKT